PGLRPDRRRRGRGRGRRGRDRPRRAARRLGTRRAVREGDRLVTEKPTKPALVSAPPAAAKEEVSKTERILNLVSFLLKERRPVPWREIAGRVVGYDDGSDPKSLERRFERDKSALKEMGG